MSFIISLLSGLSGSASKWIGYGALAGAVALLGYVGITMYGDSVKQTAAQTETIAALNAKIADGQHSIAAMSALYQEEKARAAQAATTKEAAHAAQVTTGCAISPAIRAEFNGLRNAASASGGAPKRAGGTVGR